MSAGATLNDCSRAVQKNSFSQHAFAWTWVIITFPSSIEPNLSTISLPHSTMHPTQLQPLTALGTQTRAPKNSCFLCDWNLSTALSWGEICSAKAPNKKWGTVVLNFLPVFLLSGTKTTAALSADITSCYPNSIGFAELCSCAGLFAATDNSNMHSKCQPA